MTFSVTNDGDVKMNSSSETFSSSLRSASNAKIENVDAAIRTFEPGVISFLRSSPSRFVTLSMMRKISHPPLRRHCGAPTRLLR